MEETKKCPYCGKEILAVAKKCKHCKKWLSKEVEQTKEMLSEGPHEPAPIESNDSTQKESSSFHEDIQQEPLVQEASNIIPEQKNTDKPANKNKYPLFPGLIIIGCVGAALIMLMMWLANNSSNNRATPETHQVENTYKEETRTDEGIYQNDTVIMTDSDLEPVPKQDESSKESENPTREDNVAAFAKRLNDSAPLDLGSSLTISECNYNPYKNILFLRITVEDMDSFYESESNTSYILCQFSKSKDVANLLKQAETKVQIEYVNHQDNNSIDGEFSYRDL